jgi:cysteine desulfuration protein SufE
MPGTIEERERTIVEEFELFDDWMGKYEYLIEQGRALPPLADAFRTDEYRIRGCQSQVWVRADERDGLVIYEGDSDALITRGLVALLIRVLSGLPPSEIVGARLDFIERIGLQEHLSPTRKNGLNGMIRQIKLYALALGGAVANRN